MIDIISTGIIVKIIYVLLFESVLYQAFVELSAIVTHCFEVLEGLGVITSGVALVHLVVR